MSATPQTYANHIRWHPPFHFFVLPVLLINVIWSIVYCVKYPAWNQGWWVLVSLALAFLGVQTRNNSLKVQDRIIRLEEELRYQRLLAADLAQQTKSFTVQQIIALRFASDEELPGLIDRVFAGEFAKNWRADDFRV